jgi:hypothetical protein
MGKTPFRGLIAQHLSNFRGEADCLLGDATRLFFGCPKLGRAGATVGMASLLGERGPELFVPRTAGTVVPNSALGASGGGVHFHSGAIDARGATDPAAVKAMVKRGIAEAAPAIIAGSLHANSEKNARRPAMSGK